MGQVSVNWSKLATKIEEKIMTSNISSECLKWSEALQNILMAKGIDEKEEK